MAQGALQTLAGPVHIHDALNGVQAGHPARPGGLAGDHQAAGHERRRVLQRQRRQPVREPDRADELPVDRAHPVHPGRAHLHVRQDGRQYPPGRGHPRRDGDHLRRLAGHRIDRRAPGQPGRRRGRGDPSAGRQHGGQGSPLRRHLLRALQRSTSTQTSTGSVDSAEDSYTPMGGFAVAHRDDARRGLAGRRRQRPVHDLAVRHHHGVHRRADGRANTGVPGQEDPGPGGEAGGARRAGHADHGAGPDRDSGVGPRRPGRAAQRRARTASPRSCTTSRR